MGTLLSLEGRVARGDSLDADAETDDPYWADLVRLLQIYHASGDGVRIAALRAAMSDRRYHAYIDGRRSRRPPRPRPAGQLDAPEGGG